jgi:2-phospho-L-lactate transferase/gluconeogenesis factor (CofD/UPF0052 family)
MGTGRYLAITGGVGGAKLGLGLANILPPEQLAFAVNTGDDFRHRPASRRISIPDLPQRREQY